MRILVATDFSIRSHRALRRAGLLAGPRRGKLMPMHVVEGLGTRQVAQDLREAQRMILEQVAAVPELSRAWCEPIVIGGAPVGAVLDAASAWEVDLIVVGSAPELRRRTFGRTVRSLIRVSPCPVLVVRQPVEGPYGRVLAPVDLSDASARALRSVTSLGLADGSEVTVLHAFRAPARTKLLAAGISQGHVDGYVESWRAGFAGELDGVLTRDGLGGQDWRRRVEEGRPRDVILRVAEEFQADLVAIGTHERTGLARAFRSSFTEDLLSTPGPDVLVVPPLHRASRRPAGLLSGAVRPPGSQPAPGFSGHLGCATRRSPTTRPASVPAGTAWTACDYTGALMIEADAFSVLARSAVTVADRPGDGRSWDDASVGLAAGVLQRAFRLDQGARDAFLELARRAERLRATERWRGP